MLLWDRSPLNLLTMTWFLQQVFRSPHFLFFVFGHFWRQGYENTKFLHNLCLYKEKWAKRKKNHATKVTKILKNQKTENWDERNKWWLIHKKVEIIERTTTTKITVLEDWAYFSKKKNIFHLFFLLIFPQTEKGRKIAVDNFQNLVCKALLSSLA